MTDRSSRASEKADFAEEHTERRKIELEYAGCCSTSFVDQEEGDVSMQSSTENYDKLIDDDSHPISDDIGMLAEDGREISCLRFNRELDRAQKHFIDNRDVCLMNWKVRDDARELLEKLCITIKKIISRNHVESDSEEAEALSSRMLLEQANLYFEQVRKTNVDLENNQRISQILDSTLVHLQGTLKQFRELTTHGSCTEVDKQVLFDRIVASEQFYLLLGTHSTSLFYEKNEIYQKLKSRTYKACCVCGVKCSVADESTELKDALAFKELLVVEDKDLAEWKALMKDDEDELGAFAQKCFHVASVEYEKKYYHILHIEEPDSDNPMEQSCCLIHNGKLLRLPACDECFDRLKKAHKLLYDNPEGEDSPKSKRAKWDKAIALLKSLSFKRCDLGRIPKSLPKLSNCGRTAIAPFVAYTIIRQLRSSRHLPGSAQHATKGSKFSIPSEGVAGKEFVIPLLHDEFINSFQKDLPRENIAERHRVLFLGNEND